VVPIDSDFLNGKAVMKSPSVQLVDRVLRLRTPAGRLEIDWRGEAPKFSHRVLAHNRRESISFQQIQGGQQIELFQREIGIPVCWNFKA
jgi:hypothetical protein